MEQKITIITPCSRPENIKTIQQSINFQHINWIIVYDGKCVNKIQELNHPQIQEHIHTDKDSIKGTAQRNYALKFVESGFVYFLDDDNIIHPNFYQLIDIIEPGKFYTFNQQRPKRIAGGDNIVIERIDTAMFLLDISLAKGVLWNNTTTHDGEYIVGIKNLHPDKWVWINKTMCYYNKI